MNIIHTQMCIITLLRGCLLLKQLTMQGCKLNKQWMNMGSEHTVLTPFHFSIGHFSGRFHRSLL